MINKAIDLGVNKAYVVMSSSLDGKNPVPCSDSAIPKQKINQMPQLFRI